MDHQSEPAQLAYTSMCVWENIQICAMWDSKSDLSHYIERMHFEIYVAETRFAMIEFAKHIEILYAEVSNFYHKPFDLEFVPACINKAFELFGHLGALPGETIRAEDMRMVWVLMQGYGTKVRDLLDPLAEYTARHCVEVRDSDGKTFITDYDPDEQLQALGEPFFSVSRATPSSLPMVISDLDSWEHAQSLIAAIKGISLTAAAA
jgi:hypothetical protein